MTTFTCGCTEDGTERCATHEPWACHSYPVEPFLSLGHNPVLEECPPCFTARLRSVSLDGRATPTRNRHE